MFPRLKRESPPPEIEPPPPPGTVLEEDVEEETPAPAVPTPGTVLEEAVEEETPAPAAPTPGTVMEGAFPKPVRDVEPDAQNTVEEIAPRPAGPPQGTVMEGVFPEPVHDVEPDAQSTVEEIAPRPTDRAERRAEGRGLIGFLATYSFDRFGTFFPLYEGKATIGRSQDSCQMLVPDRFGKVSGVHAVLKSLRGRLSIRDLDSTNGTFVDVNTVDMERYPELYEEAEDSIVEGEFDGRPVRFVCIEDEQITLRENSYIRLGASSVILKVKLVE